MKNDISMNSSRPDHNKNKPDKTGMACVGRHTDINNLHEIDARYHSMIVDITERKNIENKIIRSNVNTGNW